MKILPLLKLNQNSELELLKESNSELYNSGLIIVKKIQEKGFKAYFVGGSVRDSLLGNKTPKDIDIATNATPEQIKEIFTGYKISSVGAHFGVIIVNLKGFDFEIATFRKDGTYLDGRRPESVEYSDEKEDAQRRDFTINSIFFDPITGEYIDYFNGKKDITDKVIRTVGNPKERFSEDYLRVLRAVRFASQKGFEIEPETLNAIKEVSGNINLISKERIKMEIDKILLSKTPSKYLTIMLESNLLKELFPELIPLVDEDQNPEHHPEGNVYVHTMNALDESYMDLNLRWAILFHDIGKPSSRRIKDGRIMHPGHEEVSWEMTKPILEKYKFDNKSKEEILWLIKNHGIFMTWKNLREIKKKEIVTHPLFDKLLKHYEADRRSSRDSKIIEDFLVKLKIYKDFIDNFKRDSDKWDQMLKFTKITGNDLLELGFQGMEMRIILGDVKEKYQEDKLKTKEELIEYIKSKYLRPKIQQTLEIGGKDLKDLGYQGLEIKQKLDFIIDAVISGKLQNNKEEILKFIGN